EVGGILCQCSDGFRLCRFKDKFTAYAVSPADHCYAAGYILQFSRKRSSLFISPVFFHKAAICVRRSCDSELYPCSLVIVADEIRFAAVIQAQNLQLCLRFKRKRRL